MRGRAARSVGATAVVLLLGTAPRVGGDPTAEVLAVGVPRPSQLAVEGRTLVVLSPGPRGDAAAELYRVDLDGPRPVDLSREPRTRIPFPDARTATLGSLTLDPGTGGLLLGEENGTRVWRLDGAGRLILFATGLRRLAGGSTLLVDGRGRLVLVDWVDPVVSPDEERAPPGLEQFREEDYRGPLVLRLALDPALPLPRRVERLAPLFPRAWGGRRGGGLLPRLVAAAPRGTDELAVLSSGGELYRLASDGRLTPLAALPRGQYLRVNMVSGPDGALYVSSGFWVMRLFRVDPDGTVRTLAEGLADPQGLALADGQLYLAESALHRILRLPLR
jgi:hypothetical protein